MLYTAKRFTATPGQVSLCNVGGCCIDLCPTLRQDFAGKEAAALQWWLAPTPPTCIQSDVHTCLPAKKRPCKSTRARVDASALSNLMKIRTCKQLIITSHVLACCCWCEASTTTHKRPCTHTATGACHCCGIASLRRHQSHPSNTLLPQRPICHC